MYKMPLQSMLEFAKAYPVKKIVGQWKHQGRGEAAIIQRDVFVNLPFVRRFQMWEPSHPWEKKLRHAVD
jgi:hypothetical protein